MFDFGSVFDELPEELGDYLDSAWSAYSTVSSGKKSSASDIMRQLGGGNLSTANKSYSAGKTAAIASEDPFAFEVKWKERFKAYGQTANMTEVKV